MKSTLLYLLLLLSAPILAQENIILRGIIETDTLENLPIHIINLTQKSGTTSALDGTFEIRVRENDTILFSAVQFQVLKVPISEEILQKKFLIVHLKTLINELEEVRITDIKLSGNLKTDLANMKLFTQPKLGFPIQEDIRPTGVDKIYASYSSSPLMLMINTINGNIKRLERAAEVIKFDKYVDAGINAVSVSLFVDELEIAENEIFNFVNFCAQNDNFQKIVSGGDVLELIYFYYQEAPFYKNSLLKDPLQN